MILRALILWLGVMLGVALPAAAAPVQVTTGEHEGFTRVVLNFQREVEWEMGRSDAGYLFRAKGIEAEYDLAPVFQRIGKTRLAAISAQAGTAEVNLGIACPCHAIAFEFRPGIIVIDLRDGAPPKGSAFESPLAASASAPPPPPAEAGSPGAATTANTTTTAATPAAADTAVATASSPYNWLDRFAPAATAGQTATQPAELAPLPSTLPSLQPMREQLLRQLSRGASEGVINLAMPAPNAPKSGKSELDAARVALGELTGVITTTARSRKDPTGAQGEACIASADLTVLDWAEGKDTPSLLAQDMPDLVGEFDAPQPEAVTRAVRARIHLGFGLEARLILTAFPDVAEGAPALMSLSYIIDGEDDPTGAFRGQGRCNTAAALWAAMSDKGITQGVDLNEKATVLAFSALPNHLRRLLGPRLIDRFLELGDETSATTIRNIIFRVTDQMTSEISVAAAKIDLAKGDAAKAETYLESSDQGAAQTSAAALVTRVKARVAQGVPIDRETVTALHALQNEMKNTDMAGEIAIAIIHAEAASGNFPAAFAALTDQPAEAPVVWDALVHLGDDTAFLTYAVPAPTLPVDGLARADVEDIMLRLLDLALPDVALDWARGNGLKQGQALAQVHLARRDGNAAVAALAGESGEDVASLRARAYGYLGDYAQAAAELAPVADAPPIAEWARGKDWPSLAEVPTSPWFALANDIQAPPLSAPEGVDTFGPLARGLALVDQSAATRAKIEKLLGALPVPDPAPGQN
jgi:hypothetical protein